MAETSKPSELEILRFFGDQAARAETLSPSLNRAREIQRVVAKMQALSDEEFALAFGAFSSIIENCHSKKTKSDIPKSKVTPEKALKLGTEESNRTQAK